VGKKRGGRLDDGEERVTFMERARERRRALREQLEKERMVVGSKPWRRTFWA
jgi:hypothetical protein